LPFTRWRLRLLLRTDAFVTLSREIEDELAASGLGRVPCHRIPNGVDLEVFRPASREEQQALRVRLGLPERRVLGMFAGRLTPQKDPGLLLEAWMASGVSGAHLVFVGDGPLRASLERHVASRPAAGRIGFAGATGHVADYLRAADFLVLPSRAEGMSNALLEAMACGLPVAATDVPGNRALLGDDGKAGLLVPPDNPAPLTEAMQALIASSDLRREMGVAARALVEERHDIRDVAGQFLSVCAALSPSSCWPPWR
jgi:glycosyltransferase involved in cell wall biosynthesis